MTRRQTILSLLFWTLCIAASACATTSSWHNPCRNGDTQGCAELFVFVQKTSKEDGKAILSRACLEGSDYACMQISNDPRVYRTLCASGYAPACAALVQANPKDAVSSETKNLLEKSCDDGMASACSSLMERTQSFEVWLNLHRRVCETGNSLMCAEAAASLRGIDSGVLAIYRTTDGIRESYAAPEGNTAVERLAEDDPRIARLARSLTQKACELGHPESCYFISELVPTSEAGRYLHLACRGGVGSACDKSAEPECLEGKESACLALGPQEGTLSGMASVDRTAALREACDRGTRVACKVMAEYGGLDAEYGLQKSCEDGDRESCQRYADILAEFDLPKALSYLGKICDSEGKGQADACFQGGEYLRNKDSVSWLIKACKLDHDQACKSLALTLYDDYEHEARDRLGAIFYFRKFCGSENAEGGIICDELDDQGGDEGSWQALDQSANACEKNMPEACARAGQLILEGLPSSVDRKNAERLLQKGCDLKSELSCNRLANLFELGMGGDKDLHKAVEILEVACGLGNEPACVRHKTLVKTLNCAKETPKACKALAELYSSNDATQADLERGLGAWELACEAGDLDVCAQLAKTYLMDTKFYPRNLELAVVAIERARSKSSRSQKKLAHAYRNAKTKCDGGDQDGCFELGKLYVHGKYELVTAATELSKGVALLGSACTSGIDASCVMLGTLTVEGFVQGVDSKEGEALLIKTCDRDVAEACAALSTYYRRERLFGPEREYLERNDIKARDFLRKACELEDATSCAVLANGISRGFWGIDADPIAGKAMLEKACRLGDKGSCP